MEHKNGIGARLMRLRGDRSQSEVAAELAIEQRTLSHWENEERRIKDVDVIKLADYYNTTCDYILRGINSYNIDIHKATGLTDESISQLSRFASRPDNSSGFLRTINYLLGSEIGIVIVGFIDSYFRLPNISKSVVNIYFDGKTAYTGDSFCDEENQPNGELVPFVDLMEIAEAKIFERIRRQLELARGSGLEADYLSAELKNSEAIIEACRENRKKD